MLPIKQLLTLWFALAPNFYRFHISKTAENTGPTFMRKNFDSSISLTSLSLTADSIFVPCSSIGCLPENGSIGLMPACSNRVQVYHQIGVCHKIDKPLRVASLTSLIGR